MPDEELERKPFDANDPVQVEKAKRAAGRQRRADADIVRKIMLTSEGRSWMYRKLVACHIYEPSFVPGSSDITAYREGERNVGNLLLQEVQLAAPQQYIEMVKEGNARDG